MTTTTPELEVRKAKLAAHMLANYLDWTKNSQFPKSDADYHVEFETGHNYCRIVHCGRGNSRSCLGFIVIKPTKGFKFGDLLKSGGWKAPATNFARGNIFNDADIHRVVWTGVM